MYIYVNEITYPNYIYTRILVCESLVKYVLYDFSFSNYLLIFHYFLYNSHYILFITYIGLNNSNNFRVHIYEMIILILNIFIIFYYF